MHVYQQYSLHQGKNIRKQMADLQACTSATVEYRNYILHQTKTASTLSNNDEDNSDRTTVVPRLVQCSDIILLNITYIAQEK